MVLPGGIATTSDGSTAEGATSSTPWAPEETFGNVFAFTDTTWKSLTWMWKVCHSFVLLSIFHSFT